MPNKKLKNPKSKLARAAKAARRDDVTPLVRRVAPSTKPIGLYDRKLAECAEGPTVSTEPPAVQTPSTQVLASSENLDIAFLVPITGDQIGHLFNLADSISIGRDAVQNDIVLYDASISRQHAKMRRDKDASGTNSYYLYDLGSTNGTFVNNQRIVQYKLVNGDFIQIGNTTLVFISYDRADLGSREAIVKSVLPLQVFLCHSSSDKPTVRELYEYLQAKGFDPWLDEEKLLPGEDWDREITRAVRSSHVVVVCLSKKAVTKEGYLQKEIRVALDAADEKLEGAIFIIPLKLEECDVPERLRRWQWVNYFDPNGFDRLMLAFRKRAEALGLNID